MGSAGDADPRRNARGAWILNLRELASTHLVTPCSPRGGRRIQLNPPRGEHRRPTFVLGAFVAALVGAGSRSRKAIVGKSFMLGVRMADSWRVLEGSRQLLGWSSACSGRFSAESRRVHGTFFAVFHKLLMYLQRALADSRFGWHWIQFLGFWRIQGCRNDPRMAKTGSHRGPRGSNIHEKMKFFLLIIFGCSPEC